MKTAASVFVTIVLFAMSANAFEATYLNDDGFDVKYGQSGYAIGRDDLPYGVVEISLKVNRYHEVIVFNCEQKNNGGYTWDATGLLRNVAPSKTRKMKIISTTSLEGVFSETPIIEMICRIDQVPGQYFEGFMD